MQFVKFHQEAAYAMAHVPTASEAATIAGHYEKAQWWNKRGEQALWETDGFSMTAFVAGPAAEDERKQAERLQCGGFGLFRVFVRLDDMQIVATQPEELQDFKRIWDTEWKWVVRDEHGRMQRDSAGRWMIYPVSPKRASTHESRGYGERYAVLPYRLVDRKESIGAAMKRGIGVSQLDRVPTIRIDATTAGN
ncbi:TPA: hypothetical protein ACYLN4_000905 [Burkholderia lata]